MYLNGLQRLIEVISWRGTTFGMGQSMITASGRPIRDNSDKHRFEMDLGNGALAIAEYTLPAGKILFTHTEVPPAHEGQGLGTALIKAALAAARERELEVLPICPFFAAYMKKHVEVQDLLDPAYRKALGIG